MAAVVWFGNRDRQAWIPAPKAGMDWSIVKRSTLIQLEHGGVYTDDSIGGHREGTPEWEGTPDELRPIRDFFNRVWGPPPFYWVEPSTADLNMLSPNWATPGIIADGDWSEIHDSPSTPATMLTGQMGTPTRAATYSPTNLHTAAIPAARFTLLIPPGHKLAFGAYGTRTGSAVVALRGTTATGLTSTSTFAPLDPAGANAWSSTNLFPASADYRVVDIFLARTSAVASTITLSGMRAAVIRANAVTQTTAPFASGEGVGALEFSGGLRETILWGPSTIAPSRRHRAMSARLVEIQNDQISVGTPGVAPTLPTVDGGTP